MKHSTYSPGGGGSSEGDEILEQRGWRMPVRFGWPPRSAVVLGAIALLVGLAAGYAAGSLRAGKTATPPALSRAAVASAGPSPVPGSFPLSQAGTACFMQTGRELQVGVQVTNVSSAVITLRRVEVVLPLGGLRAVAQAWGTCGELPGSQPIRDNILPAGASAWFTVTFRVLVRCPQPLPVLFIVDYVRAGRPGLDALPGFDDLGQIPYAGCT